MKQQALDLKTHPITGVSLIEASAGTGKTYTITHLYARSLLETEYQVQQILVVTFTNAATQELKGRIRQLLHELWDYLDGSQSHKVFDTLYAEYRGNQTTRLKLQQALINFDEAAIYSIHGFCQRVLNSFPIETHSLIEQHIVPDELELKQSALLDFWRQHIINLELIKLAWVLGLWKTPDKLLRACEPLMSYQETAGLQQDDAEDNILQTWQSLAQHWQSSQHEISAVLLNNPALNGNKVQAKTVNVLLEQLNSLFKHVIPYALPPKWELITTKKLVTCLKKDQTDDRIFNDFFQLAEQFGLHHEAWLRQQKLDILLQASNSIQSRITQLKKDALNVSFNDLIQQLSDVLKKDNGTLSKRIRETFPMAMVDEFQDTDSKQYAIFKILYPASLAKDNPQSTIALIMIGDPKQAIYSFRGADVFTYQQAKQNTQKQFTLDINYRSTADYIELVNRLFNKNENAFIYKQLIEFNISKASDHAGSITQQGKRVSPLVSWFYPFTPKPENKAHAEDYFSSVCASEIKHILQQQTLLLDGEKVQAKDLAILVRKGSQASLMKSKLAQQGISAALISRESVFSTRQAREITLLLEVLIDPTNSARLYGLLSTDLFCWNASQIHGLQSDNRALVTLLEQVKSYQNHWQEKGLLSMFFQLLDDQQTLNKNSQHMESERRMTNWIHIMEQLQQQAGEHASLSQALNWLRMQREQSTRQAKDEYQLRLESDRELVKIVTIHKSKGLEYPIVFLPFIWDGKDTRYEPESYTVHDNQGNKQLVVLSEDNRKRWREENLAEEVRLFYVAMTRARYRTYLGWGNIKNAGNTAIAHCLYSDKLDKTSFPYKLELNDVEELHQPFIDLNKSNKLVEIKQHDEDSAIVPGTIQPDIQACKVKTFRRHVEQQWRISSYSQIASSGEHDDSDRPDYDAKTQRLKQTETIIPTQELNRFAFFKGAKAGNFLHDLLEHQPFNEPPDRKLISSKCRDYGIDDEWVEMLCQWIDDILNCDIGHLQLRQLKPRQKICEMEFYMSCQNLRASTLNEYLQLNRYSHPYQVFTFADIKGYLKGFIDLVFEHQGQYFIADYKSNFLGETLAFYSTEHCEQAMYEHHYHLQYLIYTLALHRYLKQRLQDYEYDHHVGGVYYLFLRGMSVDNNAENGVYFHKPLRQVIEQLDELFSGAVTA